MDRAPTHQLHEGVAELLQPQQAADQLGVVGSDGDARGIAQEVGCVEEGHVQDMALDPLAAVEEPSQLADDGRHRDAGETLEGVGGAHLVRHGADPADARGEVDGFVECPAPQERLEEPGRFVDLQADVVDDALRDVDVEGPLALHARQHGDVDVVRGAGRVGTELTVGHGVRPPPGTPGPIR
jgi:hypothetical protein